MKSRSLQLLEDSVGKQHLSLVGKDFSYKMQTYEQSSKRHILDYKTREGTWNAYNQKQEVF